MGLFYKFNFFIFVWTFYLTIVIYTSDYDDVRRIKDATANAINK